MLTAILTASRNEKSRTFQKKLKDPTKKTQTDLADVY